MHHGMLSSREKRREQNVNMRVPVAAALELRRAVVAKVVAHIFICVYIFIRTSVRVFVVMFLKRREEERCFKKSETLKI